MWKILTVLLFLFACEASNKITQLERKVENLEIYIKNKETQEKTIIGESKGGFVRTEVQPHKSPLLVRLARGIPRPD
jgi:hypothetical protein